MAGPDETMTDFLIALAVNDTVRLAFTNDKAGKVAELRTQGMSKDAADAILQSQDTAVRSMIVNQQSSGPGLTGKRAAPKIAAKKGAAKKGGVKKGASRKGAAGKGAVKSGGKKKSARKPPK